MSGSARRRETLGLVLFIVAAFALAFGWLEVAVLWLVELVR